MYFRTKKSPSGEVTQLLESYRDAAGRSRNRVVVSLGKQTIPEASRVRIAKAVEDELLNRNELFEVEYTKQETALIKKVLRLVDIRGNWNRIDQKRAKEKDAAMKQARLDREAEKKDVQNDDGTEVIDGVLIDKVEHTAGAELGPELVGLSVWKRLELDSHLRYLGFNSAQRARAAALVINRLVDPVSEHALPLWLEGTALPELLGDCLLGSQDGFYRTGDKMLAKSGQILEHVRKMEEAEFGLDRSILLYDLTNTYFEGKAEENAKACRGKSKHKRNDCPQIVVGMVFDRHGFELGHQVFEGNRSDCTTLTEMIEALEKETERNGDLPANSLPLVILDGGIATKGNLEYLRNKGYKYLVNDSRRGRGKYRESFLEAESEFIAVTGRTDKSEVLVKLINDPLAENIEDNSDNLILCKSAARREKELAIRSTMEQRFCEGIEKLDAGVKKGTLKDEKKIQRKIGALQKKYPRAAKFYDVEYIKSGPGIIIKDKEAKLEADDDMLGCYVLRTNMEDVEAEDFWQLYMTLTKAEDGFKAIKSDLGIRPNYHRLEDRVDAHVFISVLSYHLLRFILFKLEQAEDSRSWSTIKRILSTHAYATVIIPTKDKEVHRIRKPGIPEIRQKEIYKKLGVSWQGLPTSRMIAENIGR